MPISEEIRHEHRAAEIVELAITGLIVEFGISSSDAAQIIVQQASKNLTPAALRQALQQKEAT